MNTGTTSNAKEKVAAKLLEANLITEEALAVAKELQRKDGGSVGQALIKSGAIDEASYVTFMGKVYNLPVIDLNKAEVDIACIDLIPADVATKFQVLPIVRAGRVLTVAMANPSNIFAIDDIKFITGLDVQPAVAGEMAIKKSIDKFYATTDSLAAIMEGIEDDIELVEEDEEIAEVVGDERRKPL